MKLGCKPKTTSMIWRIFIIWLFVANSLLACLVGNPHSAIISSQTFVFDHRDLLDSDGIPNDANPNYDANGNTLIDGGVTTGDLYDAENHLIDTASGLQLKYDADGNRVSETYEGGTTYDQNPTGYSKVLAEYTSLSSAPTMGYAYGLGLISQKANNNSLLYYGYDRQGSVRMLTDATSSANVQITYDYDGYGDLLASSGSDGNEYRYTGQQWDSDLGMYYLRARYYSPNLGRFWSADTSEGNSRAPLSLHKYLYCQANPVNSCDKTGLYQEIDSSFVAGKEAEQPVINDFIAQRGRPDATALRSIHGILDYASKTGYNGLGRLIPDLVDISHYEIYDVKSWKEYPEGMAKVQAYAIAFNQVDPDPNRGGKWHAGVTYEYGGFNPMTVPGTYNGKPVCAVYFPTQGGVIPYKLYQYDDDQDMQRIPLTVPYYVPGNVQLPIGRQVQVETIGDIIAASFDAHTAARSAGIAFGAGVGAAVGVAVLNASQGAY